MYINVWALHVYLRAEVAEFEIWNEPRTWFIDREIKCPSTSNRQILLISRPLYFRLAMTQAAWRGILYVNHWTELVLWLSCGMGITKHHPDCGVSMSIHEWRCKRMMGTTKRLRYHLIWSDDPNITSINYIKFGPCFTPDGSSYILIAFRHLAYYTLDRLFAWSSSSTIVTFSARQHALQSISHLITNQRISCSPGGI